MLRSKNVRRKIYQVLHNCNCQKKIDTSGYPMSGQTDQAPASSLDIVEWLTL